MKFYLYFFLSFFHLMKVHAIECKWWQSKIPAHQVNPHQREGSQVSAHIRREHCREKWHKADFFINAIKDKLAPKVEISERIKAWKKSEVETLLKILSTIPEVYELENYHFYRSRASEHLKNPAVIYESSRSIILFDIFFESTNKDQILVHESGHYLYSKLPINYKLEFLKASGWTKTIVRNSELYIPPKNLIKDDSAVSQDEDFANHLEVYFKKKSELKVKNPKVFELFKKRFKE